MTKRTITLARYGVQQGILEWDTELGKFYGFDAEAFNACGGYGQSHPAMPFVEGSPRYESAPLALLAMNLGYDIPDELKAATQDVTEGKTDVPPDTVA